MILIYTTATGAIDSFVEDATYEDMTGRSSITVVTGYPLTSRWDPGTAAFVSDLSGLKAKLKDDVEAEEQRRLLIARGTVSPDQLALALERANYKILVTRSAGNFPIMAALAAGISGTLDDVAVDTTLDDACSDIIVISEAGKVAIDAETTEAGCYAAYAAITW